MSNHLRRSRWVIVAAVPLVVLVASLLGAASAGAFPSECSQSGLTVTCTYTSGSNSFTVPDEVSTVHVVVVGGAGADGNGTPAAPGGLGARVEGDLPVAGGSALYALVGGNGLSGGRSCEGDGGANGGGAGCFGAGGGGASDVRTSLSDLRSRLVVAGGGGGGGNGLLSGEPLEGGGTAALDLGGGGAGGNAEVAGGTGQDIDGLTGSGGGGGDAGTTTAGGTGGSGGVAGDAGDPFPSPGCAGGAGSLGAGGAAGGRDCATGGGGGGGGLYGGGAGGGGGRPEQFSAGASGGGGGGSSLVPSGGSISVDGTAAPKVVISYTVPNADVKLTINGPSSARSGSQNTYVINVSNDGPATARSVVLSTQVPNGTKYAGVSTTQGICTHPASGSTSGTIICSVGDIASGATALQSVTLKITLNAKGGSIAIVGQVSSSVTPDPSNGNNVASLSTTIVKK